MGDLKNKDDNKKSNKTLTYIYAGAGLLIFIVIILSVNYYKVKYLSGTSAELFGFSEALFSGLAFVGLIITLLMQRDELEMQRNEINESQKILEGQEEQLRIHGEQMGAQNLFLKRQQIENSFFKMLELYNQILSQITVKRSVKEKGATVVETINGKKAIQHLIDVNAKDVISRIRSRQQCQDAYKEGYVPDETRDNLEIENEVKKQILKCLDKNSDELGHYFRYIFQIIKFIDERLVDRFTVIDSEYGKKQKTEAYLYMKLLRAQLSNSELALLFYNSLTKEGDSFNKLGYFKDYALLKNLEYEGIVPIELLKKHAGLNEEYFESNEY